MTYQEFLNALRGPAINAAVGVILAVIGEYLPMYQDLLPKTKKLLFAGLCFVVPLVASFLAVQSGYADGSFEGTYWPAIIAGATAFTAGQGTHWAAFMGKGRRV